MASQCKRQQCTIDRRGFRQELDSWRHKLIHCVGFESILEGLFTPELVEDLQLFKDCEPTAVSDWSFVENCLFCCFRRDKVKEHLIGLSSDGLEDTKSVLVKDKSAISRLEKQAEEFLHAVLSRKDVPNFSDPNIPVVAREILQRMIRQFAAEYTSKTSGSAQDPQPCSDRRLPTTPSPSGAKPPSSSPPGTPAGPTTHSQAGTPKHNQAGPAAHSLNPVLSKLLMADQDAPLDLTIKKPPPLPSDQDGVLDLSIKKSRSSSLSARSPCLSPAPATLKGRSLRADGQVGLFMRSLQDGGTRGDGVGHCARYKPSSTSSLAYSLHIKEETDDLESDPESPLDQTHLSSSGGAAADLFTYGSKSHFGALLKLKTNNNNSNSEASEHLKDIPRLLEAAGLLTKSLAYEREERSSSNSGNSSLLSLSRSPSFDLKIPQVRNFTVNGTEPSWDSVSTEYSTGSLLCESVSLGKALRSFLPGQQLQKKGSGGFSSSGSEKEYWPYAVTATDRQAALGGSYPLDSESDLANKQPRKKRGRYRQYNMELLEEAIGMVMGGKLSTSKAQTVYGIPHSTLEYKVKERMGTLKHPPKKKLKLLGQDGGVVPLSPERREIQTSQCIGPERNMFI